MKKTLFPLAIVFSLLAVACSKSDSGSSSSAKAGILPQFSADSLKNKTPATPSKKTLNAYVAQALKAAAPATTFEPDTNSIGDQCFSTEEGASQVDKPGQADLKSAVTQYAEPILCYLDTMDKGLVDMGLEAGTKNSLLVNGKVAGKYSYAPDSISADGVTYSQLVFFDTADNALLAMMWSKEPKRLAVVAAGRDEDGFIDGPAFVYLEAYQKEEDFHFKSMAVNSVDPADSTGGVWMQLSYKSSLGAFFGIEGYSLKSKDGTQASITGVLKGNVKTNRAGINITQSESGAVPITGDYYFGDFTGVKDYKVADINDTTTNFVPQIFDSASKKVKPLDKIITLESMKSLALPAFTDPIYTK